MVRNEGKYDQAVQFRKRGFTLEEIAKVCDVSKSTASKWLKNKGFSKEITAQNQRRARQENGKRLTLIQKTRATERTKRYQETERSALTEYKHYKTKPLFMASLMLYVSHGDTSNSGTIRITSSQQTAHQIFIKFLVDFCGVSRADMRLQLILQPKQSEEACMRLWQQKTRLPLSQFHKTQYLRTQSKKKPLHSGVGSTIIGNTVLKRKLLIWLTKAQKDLAK